MAIEEIIRLDIPVDDPLRMDICERILFDIRHQILTGMKMGEDVPT